MSESGSRGSSGLGTALVVLLLPALVWLSGACTRGYLNDQLYQMAEQEFGTYRAAAMREELQLERLCEVPALRDEIWCFSFRAAGWLEWGALLGGAVALGLLGFVAERAGQAEQHPERLPDLFAQAVRMTGVGAALLGVTLAALVAGSLMLLMVVFLERLWLGGVLGVLLVGGYAALRAARTALAWGKSLEHGDVAVAVPRAAAPELWRLVEEVAREIGTTPPDNLLLTVEPNCYAIEVPVRIPDGSVSGRTLCLSLSLLYLWDEDELRAVVAHELAHFHGEDTRYSREFAPVFRGAAEALDDLRATLGRDGRAFSILPLVPIFAFTLDRFARAAAAYSREREFVADATAARVAGASAIAAALVKVGIAAAAWNLYLARLLEEREKDPPPAGGAVAWLTANLLNERTPPPWLADDRAAHPIDTHPALRERLRALGTDLDETWEEAAIPVVPASVLVPQAERIDAELSRKLTAVAALLRSARAAAQQAREKRR